MATTTSMRQARCAKPSSEVRQALRLIANLDGGGASMRWSVGSLREKSGIETTGEDGRDVVDYLDEKVPDDQWHPEPPTLSEGYI